MEFIGIILLSFVSGIIVLQYLVCGNTPMKPKRKNYVAMRLLKKMEGILIMFTIRTRVYKDYVESIFVQIVAKWSMSNGN